MDAHAQQIRHIARRWRCDTLGFADDQLLPAAAILAAADTATGFSRLTLPAYDALLAGAEAVLDRDAQIIWQSAGQSDMARLFDAAHEYGHLQLHDGTAQCAAADVTDDFGDDGTPVTVISKVDGYSPKQRREGEANLFAAELLLPGPVIRKAFHVNGWNAVIAARDLGLSTTFVRSQFSQALLNPERPESLTGATAKSAPTPEFISTGLDPSQQKAAEWEGAPYLLGAGPGTGKTRTLVARCVHLVNDRHVAPESILALTFSRKAANEMRERLLAAGVGVRSAGPWIGTFHSFGLDLLRRYGDRLGLRTGWRLLDGHDAFLLLEANLDRLGLDELSNLSNPTLYLRDILSAVSRAKDELCPPERYIQLAATMREQAGDEIKAYRAAARAYEAGEAYQVYEELLRENNACDFGDLIARAVDLLRRFPDVRADLHRSFPHILADEYQDVNRACAMLVRLAAGSGGRNLWVVGDHRQSIYRFRGASPANIAAFHQDYCDGVRDELAVNYRSCKPIVSLFAAAARSMGRAEQGGAAFGGWESQRSHNADAVVDPITWAVADDEDSQAEGIARLIGEFKARGDFKFADQAILCRTHYQAATLSQRLGERGIPVIYGENLLERPEVSDLLSVLQAGTNERSSAIGLVRMASLPEFGLTPTDAAALAKRVAESRQSASAALKAADPTDDDTPAPTTGLRALARVLGAIADERDPAAYLERFLFQESNYLRNLIGADAPSDLATVSRLAAIRQLLEMARSFHSRSSAVAAPTVETSVGDESDTAISTDSALDDTTNEPSIDTEPSADKPKPPPDPRVRFLNYVRRLVAAGERPTLDLGDDAGDFDAVRMITAHAAKGLEFPVVFLPNLSEGKFPTRPRTDFIPEPPGLIDDPDSRSTTAPTGKSANGDREEEECLFFVALSRARDHLVLTRAKTYGENGREEPPSTLLDLVRDGLREAGIAETVWSTLKDADESPVSALVTPSERGHYKMSELESYQRCPRQYYYARRLELAATLDPGAGELLYRAMSGTMRWLRTEWQLERTPDLDTVTAEFDRRFVQASGDAIGHEQLYRSKAHTLLATARDAWQSEALRPLERGDTLSALLDSANVHVSPDLIGYDKSGHIVIARHVLSRPKDNDHTDIKLALYRKAAEDSAPGTPVKVEVRYLTTGTKRQIPRSDRWEPGRVKKYDEAARRIGLGQFPADPREDGMCATCAFYFICPA